MFARALGCMLECVGTWCGLQCRGSQVREILVIFVQEMTKSYDLRRIVQVSESGPVCAECLKGYRSYKLTVWLVLLWHLVDQASGWNNILKLMMRSSRNFWCTFTVTLGTFIIKLFVLFSDPARGSKRRALRLHIICSTIEHICFYKVMNIWNWLLASQ